MINFTDRNQLNPFQLKRFLPLILALVFYFILGIDWLHFFQYQLNGDAPGYLSIGYAIIHKDFFNSINAHWGIFYSVLLSPFLLPHFEQPLIGIKLSSLIIGSLGLIGFYLFTELFKLPKIIFLGLIFTSGFLFLYFAFYLISPDLLVLILLLFYFKVSFSKSFGLNIKDGLITGILGGLLFLTKEYFLYYFFIHFSFLILLQWLILKYNQKIIIKTYLLGLGLFFSVVITWAILLHAKYGYFMLGNRGSISFGLAGPASADFPMFTQGLIPPPNPYGFSSWDDPTNFNIPKWSPFESRSYFFYEVNKFKNNIDDYLQILNSSSFLVIPIILISIIYLSFKRKQLWQEERLLFSTIITLLTYPVGYLILAVEPRYIWPSVILTIILACFLLSKIKSKPLQMIWLVLILTTFIRQPTNFLRREHFIDHTFYDQSKILKNDFGISNKKIASNNNWHQTLYISVYDHNYYYGFVKPNTNFNDKLAELQKYNIDYYFSWNEDPDILNFRSKFTEIKNINNDITNLRVFDLKK